MLRGQIQVFSAYSLLKSPNRLETVLEKAQALGYNALALTDLDTMAGVYEFTTLCQKYQIKPLYGLTLQYAKEAAAEEVYTWLLLAQTDLGYQNLMKISSYRLEHPEKVQPLSAYQEYFNDLVVVTGGASGELEALVAAGEEAAASALLKAWRQLLGGNCQLYGALVFHDLAAESLWRNFMQVEGLPAIAVQPVRYLTPDDAFICEVLGHISAGTTLQMQAEPTPGLDYLPEATAFYAAYEEADARAALQNLETVLAACQVTFKTDQHLQPHYPLPAGVGTAKDYLEQLCLTRLPKRIEHPTPNYQERLNYELAVISDMGFADYFLIVWDVLDYAHRAGIVVGAGRGSAAGSLVSYVLGITDVDPIRYHLLFERFLNKERYTMPDIDIDLPDNRREEVLQYVAQKYGYHHVAQIATFGTMAAKQALRDVARVFGLSQSESNQWSQAVPNELKITLQSAYEKAPKLRKLVDFNLRNQQLFAVAQKIEGLPRHTSVHAAGVVISDRELTEYIPLQAGNGEIPVTQFTMGAVEQIGLLKMDFLGLRNLTILAESLTNIQRLTGETLSLADIPLDDAATLALFQKGETTGIFQFESAGIRNVLRKLGPESLEDITAVNALYRPGPMENIEVFIKRKKGQLPVTYPHENLKPILDVTYGIIVYQEQIMQIAATMAGFSLGEADILRRGISKKKKDVLDKERLHFVEGAKKQGYSEKVASEVYAYIERFANYGFNRSHALAYSMVGYQMAFLKVHYPAAFFAALLNSVRHDSEKVKAYVTEARKWGIKVLPPAINQSYSGFYLTRDEILFGFSSLKGLRRDFTQNIVTERKQRGPFKSFDDFLQRIEVRFRKRNFLEPLVFVGAFDQLEANRRQLVMELDSKIMNVEITGDSQDLLSLLELKKNPVADYTGEERLGYEVQYLGTYLSGHPTEDYPVTRQRQKIFFISEVTPGLQGNFLLLVKKIREITTKKGQQMAFVETEDASGEITVTFFPEMYMKERRHLKVGEVLLVAAQGELSQYRNEKQLIARAVRPAAEMEAQLKEPTLFLQLLPGATTPQALEELRQLLKEFPGKSPVILFYQQSRKKVPLSKDFNVCPDEKLKAALNNFLGSENVVVRYYGN